VQVRVADRDAGREVEAAARDALGHRQPHALEKPARAQRRLLVHADEEGARLDAAGRESPGEFGAAEPDPIVEEHRIHAVVGPRVLARTAKDEPGGGHERRVVARADRALALEDRLDALALREADGRLQVREAEVVASLLVHEALASWKEVAKLAACLRERVVAGHDHAALARGDGL